MHRVRTRISRARCSRQTSATSAACVFGGFTQAIDLDQQHGRAIKRKSRVHVILDRANGPPIHHLARSRRDATRRNLDHGLRRVIDRFVDREQSLRRFGQPRKFHRDFGHQSESAFGADEKPGEIVARRIERGAAKMNEFAARQHDLKRQHMIRRHAISERMRPAGIFGDVAANRASLLARWIGGEMQLKMLNGKRFKSEFTKPGCTRAR